MISEWKEAYFRKPENNGVADLCLDGKMDMQTLDFLAESIKEFKIPKTTLTKDGNLRLAGFAEEVLEKLLTVAKDAGLTLTGAYARRPVRIYCCALSGMTPEEPFDVRPYAEKAREFIRSLPETAADSHPHLNPHSNPHSDPHSNPHSDPHSDPHSNLHSDPHSIFRIYFAGREEDLAETGDCDMLFLAQEGHLFQIRLRDEHGEWFTLTDRTEAGHFLSYLRIAEALYGTGLTRETYPAAFWEKMRALTDEERAAVTVETKEITKKGKGDATYGPRIFGQKQPDLYTVLLHPFGGVFPVSFWKKIKEILEESEDVEIRIDRQMNFYICNLLADEVHLPMTALPDCAYTTAERSGASDRCSLCSHGNLDPQVFIRVMLKELRVLNLKDHVLPTFTISGCERCCRNVPKETLVFVACSETPEGQTGQYCQVRLHKDGVRELGCMPRKNICAYLMSLGSLVQTSGGSFDDWYAQNPQLMKQLTDLYCKKDIL